MASARNDVSVGVALFFKPAVVKVDIHITNIAQTEIADRVGGIQKNLFGRIAVAGTVRIPSHGRENELRGFSVHIKNLDS